MNICIRSLRRSVFMGSLFVLLQMQAMSAQQLAAPKRLSTAAVAAGPQATAQSVSSPPEVVPALPVPRLIKFSGVAKDASGQPDSGVAGVTFSIYAEQQGGAALWMETQNTQLDAQGHYAVLLGSSQSEGMPLSLFATGEPRWLGVKVDLPGRVEQPRVLLVSVPYALKASDADTVGGKPASAFVLAPTGSGSSSALGTDVSAPDNGKSRSAASNSQHPFTSTGTQNYIPIFTDNSGDLGNSNIFQNSSGNVGIGYTNPGQRLVIGAPAGGGLLNASNLVDQDMQVTLSAPGASDKHAYLGPSVATNLTLGVGGVERMRITNAGNVGIGYSNPQQRLVIASPTGGGLLNASNLADQDMQVTLTAPGASDKHAYVGPSVATNLTLGVGMVEMMRITGAGNVGIGTNMPPDRLDVNAISGNGLGVSAPAGYAIYTQNGYVGVAALGLQYPFIGTTSNGAEAVYARNDANTAGDSGVYGDVDATSGTVYGVFGNNNGGAGGAGVYGQISTNGQSSTGSTWPFAGGGVWGDGGASNNYGVIGTADDHSAGIFYNSGTGYYALYATATDSAGIPFGAYNGSGKGCNIDASGNINCSGSKNAVVPIDGGQRKVALSAVESPKNWFEDFGSEQLSKGVAVVRLDPDFAQTVNTELEYHVFLTPKGDCRGLYVSQETPASFEVHELGNGKSDVRFDYRIVALRKYFENIRMADHTNDPDPMKMMSKRTPPLRIDSNRMPPTMNAPLVIEPITQKALVRK
jgi:hypothetical protein